MKKNLRVVSALLFGVFLLTAATVPSISVAAPSVALTGGSSHGGSALVCRNADKKITRAEILDLFEAREILGIQPAKVDDVEEYLGTLVAQLQKTFGARMLYPLRLGAELKRLAPLYRPLSRGVRLNRIDDAFPSISLDGCDFEQLASYRDSDEVILYDSEIYEALDPLNRAVLRLHEAAYSLDRGFNPEGAGVMNSVFSRRIVGEMISSHWNSEKIEDLVWPYTFHYPRPGHYRARMIGIGRCEIDLGYRIMEGKWESFVRRTPNTRCETPVFTMLTTLEKAETLFSPRLDDSYTHWESTNEKNHCVVMEDAENGPAWLRFESAVMTKPNRLYFRSLDPRFPKE